MSQQDRNEELNMHDVTVKVEPEQEDGNCAYGQVSLKTKIFCVPESHTLEDASFINNFRGNEKNVDTSLSTAKSSSVLSSPILSGEKKLEPNEETPEVGMHDIRKEVLPVSSELNCGPLKQTSSLVVKEAAASNIEATKTVTLAETSHPEGIK